MRDLPSRRLGQNGGRPDASASRGATWITLSSSSATGTAIITFCFGAAAASRMRNIYLAGPVHSFWQKPLNFDSRAFRRRPSRSRHLFASFAKLRSPVLHFVACKLLHLLRAEAESGRSNYEHERDE